MTVAGVKYCPTAQTVQESENEQAVPSTPGGQEENARKVSTGASLVWGSDGRMLLFPGL